METFPIDQLKPERFQPVRAGNTRGSGPSLVDGGDVADMSGGGHWIGVMKNFSLSKPEQHRLWRAVMLEFDNGVGEMIVPIVDFTNDHLTGGTFTAGASAALRATQMTIANADGKVFEGGEFFTIVHANAGPRLYCIKMNPGPRIGNNQVVKFRPPLREAVANGAPVDIESPRFVARLTSPPGDHWPDVGPPFKARPSIQVVESSKWQADL